MLVSDVVKTALRLAGRSDAAEAVEAGTYSQDSELSHAVNAMLHCFNAVEDELARSFFPLEKEEIMSAANGRIYYTSFSSTPVKILSVTMDGKKIAYRICPEYLETEGNNLTVKYLYCPAKKELSGKSDYGGYPVGERLLSYGAASEYCLIEGAFEDSENWEKRYRDEIARLRPYEKAKGYIPARAWV